MTDTTERPEDDSHEVHHLGAGPSTVPEPPEGTLNDGPPWYRRHPLPIIGGILGIVALLLIFVIPHQQTAPTANPDAAAALNAAASAKLGDDIVKGLQPKVDGLVDRDNATRAKLKETTGKLGDLSTRFNQSVEAINAKLKEISDRQINHDALIKAIQDGLKLKDGTPLSQAIEKLDKEVAELQENFPQSAAA